MRFNISFALPLLPPLCSFVSLSRMFLLGSVHCSRLFFSSLVTSVQNVEAATGVTNRGDRYGNGCVRSCAMHVHSFGEVVPL